MLTVIALVGNSSAEAVLHYGQIGAEAMASFTGTANWSGDGAPLAFGHNLNLGTMTYQNDGTIEYEGISGTSTSLSPGGLVVQVGANAGESFSINFDRFGVTTAGLNNSPPPGSLGVETGNFEFEILTTDVVTFDPGDFFSQLQMKGDFRAAGSNYFNMIGTWQFDMFYGNSATTGTYFLSVSTPVPEPSTYALLGSTLAFAALRRRATEGLGL